MKTQRLRHVVDFLFAAALFGVFLVSSVMVVAVGAGAYRSITGKAQEDSALRTSLSYVSEKLRQADSEGALSIGTVRDSISLALKQEYRGESYTTYIYEFDGSLCELFIRSDASAEPEYGTRLLELSDFQVERLADALYRVSIVTEDGKKCFPASAPTQQRRPGRGGRIMKSVTGTQRRSSLFLIELMISIFFFAIASSVCIQLFAEARRITEETTAENQALLQAQSAASVFYAGGGTLQLFPESFPGADTAGGTWAAVLFLTKTGKSVRTGLKRSVR